MFVFRKIWRALFSWYLRFEILPFALYYRLSIRFLAPHDALKGWLQSKSMGWFLYDKNLRYERVNQKLVFFVEIKLLNIAMAYLIVPTIY